MDSIKEKLRTAIDLLTEEEAKQMFDWLSEFERKNNVSLTMRRLANDPAFKLPKPGSKGFKKVIPAQTQGPPASDLLSEDRG